MNIIGRCGKWLRAEKQYPNGSSFTRREVAVCMVVAVAGILLCMVGISMALNVLADVAAQATSELL